MGGGLLHSDSGHPRRVVGDRSGRQEQWEPGRQTWVLQGQCERPHPAAL